MKTFKLNSSFIAPIYLFFSFLFASFTTFAQQSPFHVGDAVEVKGMGGKWSAGKVTEVNSITLANGPSYSYRVLYNPYGSGSKPIQDWIYPANLRAASPTTDNKSSVKSLQKPKLGQYHFFDASLQSKGYFTLVDDHTYFAGTNNTKRGEYKISGKELVFVSGPFSGNNLNCELIYGDAGTAYEGQVTHIKFIFNKGKSNQEIAYYKYSGQKK